MSKVYVVTSGEYSSYSICQVFTTRELAEAYIAARQPGERRYGGLNEVEEYDLWDTQPESHEMLVLSWRTLVDPSPVPDLYPTEKVERPRTERHEIRADEASRRAIDTVDVDASASDQNWKIYDYSGPEPKLVANMPGYVLVTVAGFDHERVRKVMGETKARVKATLPELVEQRRQERAKRRKGNRELYTYEVRGASTHDFTISEQS